MDDTEIKDEGTVDKAPDKKKTTIEKVEKKAKETKANRPRNYSHLERNPDTLDEITGGDGKMYKIPATMGSVYWAILVCMYENVSQPVYSEMLVKRVDAIMREQDEESWEGYCKKQDTTVWKRGKMEREVQPIKSVAERIVNNAKTLTRWKDYGHRLYERGHIMRTEYDGKVKPYFILYTNLECLNKKKTDKSET